MIALRIIAIAALQTAVLVYMVFDRTSILNAHDVVTLEVRPVDPQDMFRGDYVVFGYAISEIYTGPLAGDHNCVDGAWCSGSGHSRSQQCYMMFHVTCRAGPRFTGTGRFGGQDVPRPG